MSEIISIMSVGRSGVGKSSIGNCLISGDPVKGPFNTKPSAKSCTQVAQWAASKDYRYCDVPGIPDTDPDKTKDFYDIIIQEAKKELNVILFVFKYDRIDIGDYSKAKMLFRELNKSKAMKILVINDMKQSFSECATENDYKILEGAIRNSLDLTFSYVISVKTTTMLEKMSSLKEFISKTKSHASPGLKTYGQLKDYVNDLERKRDYEEEICREMWEKIDSLTNSVKCLEEFVQNAAVVTAVSSVSALFSFGLSLFVTVPSLGVTTATGITLEVTKAELKKAKDELNTGKYKEAEANLKAACKSFNELDRALSVRN